MHPGRIRLGTTNNNESIIRNSCLLIRKKKDHIKYEIINEKYSNF